MADRSDIDRVREASDIAELVGEVTTVRRAGRTFMAVCPFHEEKTPSMSLDRARGLYHCFGCGKGGDVFSFIQETQGVDFAEALEILARKAGLTITRDPAAAQRRGRQGAAIEALRQAIDIYHRRLKKAPEAGAARSYLRGRGYDVDVIDEWKLGFAGVDWDTLSKELRAAGLADNALIDAGLSKRGRHGLFDFFRGRLMFPIHDLRGDPVGFGGRKIEEIPRDNTNNPDAKYVNSPDSVIYHKANLLYGLDRARRQLSDKNPAVIVEGYTDVIAMHLAGVETAVATCGTALGDGHFDLLRRFVDRIVLAFDSDEAGSKAALRGDELESPFRLDLDLRVAVMPEGLDPADLVQEGRGAELATAVERARPLLEYRIEQEVARHDLSGPEGRARALHAAAGQVRRVQDQIARREYTRFVARVVGVDLADAEAAVERGARRRTGQQTGNDSPLDRLESELLRVALANRGDLADLEADDFADPRLHQAFLAVRDELGRTPAGELVDIGSAPPEQQQLLRALLLDPRPLSSGDEMLARVRARRLGAEIDRLEAELERLEPGSDAHSESLHRLIALQKDKRSGAEP
jgi:DNA primase